MSKCKFCKRILENNEIGYSCGNSANSNKDNFCNEFHYRCWVKQECTGFNPKTKVSK